MECSRYCRVDLTIIFESLYTRYLVYFYDISRKTQNSKQKWKRTVMLLYYRNPHAKNLNIIKSMVYE